MKLNRTPNPLDRNARNGENDNWDIIEGETRKINDKVDNFLENLSEDAFNKVIDDIRLNWSHKVDNFADLPSNPKKGETVAVENDDMIYRYDGSNWISIIPFTQFSAIAEIDNRLSSQLADTVNEQFKNSLVNRRTKRKLVVWQDDDGRAGIYTKLAPILREYGIVLSAAIYTNGKHGFPIAGLPAHDPIYISYQQMKELHEEGIVEFISHTHNHVYLDSKTDAEIHYELKTSRDILKQLGWNYKDFVYPGGRNDENIRYITSQYYESAFKVGGYPYTAPYDQYAMPRIGTPNSGYNVDNQKSLITNALNEHGFAVIMGHVDLNEGQDLDKMKQLIEHCLAEGAEFVTTRELMLEYGHYIQQGNNIMTSDGGIYAEDFGVYRNKNADMPRNAPITMFHKGTVTRLRIHGVDSSVYLIPEGSSTPFGYIECHRDKEQDVFSNQVFYDLPNNRTLRRRWNTTSNVWSDWVEINGNYHAIVDSISPSSSITAYPKGEVVRTRVTQDNHTLFDIPQIGTVKPYGFIETHRDLQQDVFSSQVFFDIRNHYVMIRRWGTVSGNWDSWVVSNSHYIEIPTPSTNNPNVDFFRKGTITKFRLPQNLATSYNVPAGSNPTFGYIETHRDKDQDVYSFQLLYDIRNKRQLMRRWTQGAWDNWE